MSTSEIAETGGLIAESSLPILPSSPSYRRVGGSIISKLCVLYLDEAALLTRRSRLLAKPVTTEVGCREARQPLVVVGGDVVEE